MRTFAPFVAALVATLVAPLAASADAKDPKPRKVDPNPGKLDVEVFQDSAGGTYVVVGAAAYRDAVKRGDSTSTRPSQFAMFYGTGKTLYQQHDVSVGSSSNRWTMSAWAPRVPNWHPAVLHKQEDGTAIRSCDKEDTVLAQVTGEKAADILAKSTFLSPLHVRASHVLARDDSGVYYYVDKLREGTGWRLLVGRKGSLKSLPLADVATDPAGELFISRTGTLKIDNVDADNGAGQIKRTKKLTWIKGERQTPLTWVDYEHFGGLPVVYRDLGVYTAIGTVCDHI